MIDFTANLLLLAQAQAQTADAVASKTAEGTPPWVTFLVVLGVMVVPFVVGWLIASAINLKDTSFRIGLVLFTATLGLTPFVLKMAQGESWMKAIRLGIDLAGGANLVFKIDTQAAAEQGKPLTSELMGRMIGAITRRLDPASQEQITVRQVGTDRIEVIVPGADREVVERKKREMTRLGSLEFGILANRREHQVIIEDALKSPDRNVRQGGRIVASWREVGWETVGEKRVQKDVSKQGDVVSRTVKRDGRDVVEFLVIVDPPDQQVTGQYLTRAYQTFDQNGGLAVGFNFNSAGASRFSTLTGRHMPKSDGFESRLAILLDEQIHSAPNLKDRISDRGQISGRFTQEEINELINVLNAGALAVPIIPEPISDVTISPTLGIDVQQKGITAIVVSSLCVFVFMILYYRFAGMVADLSLVLNLTMLLGVMSLINASFTLPGLAGIALTVGMAVDANVLLFERMREEAAKGSSLRMTIKNGFDHALPAIIDSHVTTLISALVLYMIGTDQVRGFAVSLFIGVVISLYSALYLGRLVLEICERKRWITELKMFSLIGKTHYDFIAAKRICAVASTIAIVGGLALFFYRGNDNFDIDLSGGTMVTFQFDEPQPVEDVRHALTKGMGGISLEELTLTNEKQSAGMGTRFRVRTKEQNIAKVREQVNASLEGRPVHRVKVEYSKAEPIAATTGKTESPKPDAAKKADTAPAPVEDENASKFVGGRQVELTFSSDIRRTTVEDYLRTEIQKLSTGETPKYDLAAMLFAVEGESSSGTGAPDSHATSFRKAILKIAPVLTETDQQTVLAGFQQSLVAYPVFDEVNSFESSVAQEMRNTAIFAISAALGAIVVYLWFRFKHGTFGLATVAGVVHDMLIVLVMLPVGAYFARTPLGPWLGLEDFKINMEVVAAFMTIAGYSLNDTIVVFDRLREVRGKNPAVTADMVNLCLNQTLSRTILTVWTVFMVVVILYAMGGEGIHGFAYCLFVGMITGVYSTIYVASPLMLWLINRPGSDTARATALAEAKTAAAH